jgi:pantoate--beta-alanine ligase
VVTKLLLQCRPDIAVFGEKDYQQLKVIAALVRELDLPLKIVGGPTMRERDGLAMSSRNAYLSAPEREKAALIYRVLEGCAGRIARGVKPALAVEEGRAALTQAGFVVDYLEARHAETLRAIESRKDGPIRLLAAARLGKTRLIDNVAA